jgi:ABC-type polysaccharide/polyol phosphate transport system ATPase subunit
MTMNDISMEVRNVSLRVPAYEQRERSAKSFYATFIAAAFDPPVRRYRTLLEDISLSLKSGDRLAILGKNGAGKSTLLRVLAGAYSPYRGSVIVEGRLQALLNITLGFNPDATIKENIYLRGAAMGLSILECHEIIPSVLEFSGLQGRSGDRFRVLSAGQKMRLGFSITTEVQNDILIMDEWIGAGDAEFFEKAQTRLMGKVNSAKIVVLASHSMLLLRHICNRAIYMDEGKVIADGGLEDIIKQYIPQQAAPKSATRPKDIGDDLFEKL